MHRNTELRLPTVVALALMIIASAMTVNGDDRDTSISILNLNKTMWRSRAVRASNEIETAPGKVERVIFRNATKSSRFFATKKFLEPGDYQVEEIADYVLPETTNPNWMKPDFDDSEWRRARGGPGTGVDPGCKLMLMRSRFEVVNVTPDTTLSLSVTYRGGVVVYLNGQEIARRHMPKETLDSSSLAEPYAESLYLTPDGRLRQRPGRKARGAKPLDDFNRTLVDLTIPASRLRKGVNLLAVAAYRAPANKALLLRATKEGHHIGNLMFGRGVGWSNVGIIDLDLIAPKGSNVRPNVGPVHPAALSVWNHNAAQNVFLDDPGPSLAPLHPVAMIAPRGGVGVGR